MGRLSVYVKKYKFYCLHKRPRLKHTIERHRFTQTAILMIAFLMLLGFPPEICLFLNYLKWLKQKTPCPNSYLFPAHRCYDEFPQIHIKYPHNTFHIPGTQRNNHLILINFFIFHFGPFETYNIRI